MSSKSKRKKNSITTQFVAHSKELRESIAWAHLPDNARRVLDRLELEHMRHGGAENGFLPCTYSDFAQVGIRRASVALAIRQAVCLGFLAITKHGYRSRAEFRQPSLYRLTYILGSGKSPAPTDEWRRIASPEHARAALATAARMRNHAGQPLPVTKQKAGLENAPSPDALARSHVAAA